MDEGDANECPKGSGGAAGDVELACVADLAELKCMEVAVPPSVCDAAV